MGEFMCPLSSISTLEIILNAVGDIQNENIVRKILRGAFIMGHLSKCFILNTWMYHHMHNRFDLCMKGISPAHPFSSLYSLCISICFHVFLCENVNSQVNADFSKANMEDTWFCFKAVLQYKCCSFQSCISFHPHFRTEDKELYPHWCSPLLLKAGFLAWWPQNWGLYVPVHVRTARDRLCVSFHGSSWSVKKILHSSKSLVLFFEQHLFLNNFCRSTRFEF